MQGAPNYTSNDPANPGEGVLSLIVCDSANGYGQITPASPGNAHQSPGDGDLVQIQVLSGPFATYSYTGFVQGGNIVIRQ
jgi:hypothetical protein